MPLNTKDTYRSRFIAYRWANITIKEWQKKIDRLRVVESGALRNSFQNIVRADENTGDVKITLTFNMYGRFVDMGVGNGTAIGKVKDNVKSRRMDGKMTGNKRRAKKWYSRTLRREQLRLTEILAREYSIGITDMIVKNMVSIKE